MNLLPVYESNLIKIHIYTHTHTHIQIMLYILKIKIRNSNLILYSPNETATKLKAPYTQLFLCSSMQMYPKILSASSLSHRIYISSPSFHSSLPLCQCAQQQQRRWRSSFRLPITKQCRLGNRRQLDFRV